MAHLLRFTPAADAQLKALEADPSQVARLKAVRSALGKMEVNLRHPSLKTHEWKGEDCPHSKKMFEAYAQNRTPGAFRIFWCYCGSSKDEITIIAITEHP